MTDRQDLKEIECVANRGQTYVVSFDVKGAIVSVEAVVRRGCDYGSHRRLTWHRRRGEMTLTAACAARAAVAKMRTSAP